MSLTLQDLTGAIAAALAADDDILAYCLGIYDKAHSVHEGATGYQAAYPEDYPAFTVLGWSKSRSETEPRRAYELMVGLALLDDETTDETSPSGVRQVAYRGAAAVEDLLDLAMTAIQAISTELFFDAKVLEMEPVEYFPVFVGELTLTVGFDVVMGGAEPAIS